MDTEQAKATTSRRSPHGLRNGPSLCGVLKKTDDILDVSVRTDPTLALKTRRGTGVYKVPSLRGVWYRNAFGHGGQAETLEEWLDPSRLKDDYVPRRFHLGPGPIQGREFGLRLAPADKQALHRVSQDVVDRPPNRRPGEPPLPGRERRPVQDPA